jgi:tetratricopeptide (TPR) repeat protein
MSKKRLLEQVDQAFNSQNNQKGLELLREYIATNDKDLEQLYRLAIIEEQIGETKNAGNAYLACIKHDKRLLKAYLYGGYFFQQIGELEKALALYSLGNDIDARLTLMHQNEKLSYETRVRSHHANKALRSHFTKLHSQSVESTKGSTRIANAIWPQTHNEQVNYLTDGQKPHLFYIPELEAKPIHESNQFDWCQLLEESFDDLTDEFVKLLSLIEQKGVPYLDGSYKVKGFESLVGSKNWTALNIYKDGVANNSLLSLMPKTAKVLAGIPLYKVDGKPFEVFFSLLKAGQHIQPHFGQSNHSLTVHLPIIVPKGGYLTVANEIRAWQKGKVIIFDDSYIHEAINPSEEDRVVMIFSIWHPDLSIEEQRSILASFQARSQWLEARSQHLPWVN